MLWLAITVQDTRDGRMVVVGFVHLEWPRQPPKGAFFPLCACTLASAHTHRRRRGHRAVGPVGRAAAGRDGGFGGHGPQPYGGTLHARRQEAGVRSRWVRGWGSQAKVPTLRSRLSRGHVCMCLRRAACLKQCIHGSTPIFPTSATLAIMPARTWVVLARLLLSYDPPNAASQTDAVYVWEVST